MKLWVHMSFHMGFELIKKLTARLAAFLRIPTDSAIILSAAIELLKCFAAPNSICCEKPP
jgi:hypothetical protein